MAQIPTRWFTVVATAYQGADLRFYFGGQINSFATDVSGLTGIQGPFPTLDGGPLAAAGGAVLGCSGAFTPTGGPAVNGITPGTCGGTVVVAPQRPIRAFGGFVQLGLPLSRWFKADPHGHNAGWQLLFTMGKDQVNDRDLNHPGFVAAYNGGGTAPLPLLMGKTAIGTLFYKFNNWCGFAFEQSVYATRGLNHATIYTIAETAIQRMAGSPNRIRTDLHVLDGPAQAIVWRSWFDEYWQTCSCAGGSSAGGLFASAASQKDTIRITVLDSVTRASTADNNNGVPLNCEQLTFDAYCRSTTNAPMISTLLVQEGNEPPFRISCTIESRYSRCIPLPKGESFDARKEKTRPYRVLRG